MTRTLIILLLTITTTVPTTPQPQTVSLAERRRLANETKAMFAHAWDAYMKHAFPSDVLAPNGCVGEDGWGGITLTLLDTLDT